MKNSSKALIAAGMMAGGAIGVLLAPGKGSESRKRLGKRIEKISRLMNGECSKEQLEMVRGKLEQHKARLEHHLERINVKIAEREIKS
jgi:gas vesicle protein